MFFNNYSILVSTSFLILSTLVGNAQSVVSGKILDAFSKPIKNVTIQIKQLNNKGVVTNSNGEYSLELPQGEWTLLVNSLGYLEVSKNIKVFSAYTELPSIVLTTKTSALNEVLVHSKTKEDVIKQQAFEVEVIETKEFKNVSADINQVLKTTSGIIIREVGGLGSGFNLSLNGLSGNQIRYFIDGVPLENLGSALTLNNFPINLIERLDIYKGAVPISFGSDALGGAINLITGYKRDTFLDVSYSTGSFNTHRFSFNAQYTNIEKKYFVKAVSFFNHSDNDFVTNDVPVFDLELGNNLGTTNAKRFNDKYTSAMLVAEAGIFDRKLADEWSVKLTTANNKNNRQHPDNNILRPLGDLFTQNSTALVSTSYNKKINDLSIRGYAMYGQIEETLNDTGNRRYNWTGDSVEREEESLSGELGTRKSIFKLTDEVIRSQLKLKYSSGKSHNFETNFSQNFLERRGEDTVNPLNFSFAIPNSINKNIVGVSYKLKGANKKYELSLFAKQYWFAGDIRYSQEEKETTDGLEDVNTNFSETGYGAGIAFYPTSYLTVKASYEKGYRIPESFELLGDGSFIIPNPDLKPEVSDNLNLSYRFTNWFNKFKVSQETNLFYRGSEDFINFRSIGGPVSNYENLTDVLARGVESSIQINYNNIAEVNFNYTYQKITDQNEFDEGLENQNFEEQLPNRPVSFWNVRAGTHLLKQKLNVFWTVQNVDKYFLSFEHLGSDNLDIPAQLTHNLDVDYAFDNGKYNVSLSMVNITDELAYDNFRIQKPGRAFYVKFRYFINNK